MTSIAEDVATNLVQRTIDGAIREVNYLCCFKSHVENFEKKRRLLVAKKDGVEEDIEDAKKRNETQVEHDVQLWLNETNVVIDEDTETNLKCFHGWCPNCIWKYRQGKKLSKKIVEVTRLIESSNFDRVARLAQPPGIEYYSPQNFIDFDSRKSKFKKLVDILQDGSYNMIGLIGLGGTGKTTLATKVGERVEESKAFQKVIFAVVSNPPNISKIRRNIAGQLELKFEEGKEEGLSKDLWSRISNYEGKVLIILDDIWEELDLKDIGIPYGPNHENCCVLITTRDLKVSEAMGCETNIMLATLSDEDAMTLFIKQVGTRSDDSSLEFKELASGIAKGCGGIPLAIVALATTLKGWSLQEWRNTALKALQNSEPLRNVHSELEEKVYRSLKLSYDHLDEKAKDLLLLCSLFPEDFEIPIDLLSKLGIGLGFFGEFDNYSEARRKVVPVKNDLIKSSLLLEARKNCVKMHDLVHEVALWIADQKVQVIMDSSAKLKSNLQFLSWRNDDFPNCFEGTSLEILIMSIKGKGKMRDATIFEGMTNLKVLFLEGPEFRIRKKRLSPSFQSLFSLKNIRTLIFRQWKLGDISLLKNLECLETFELEYCFITELPKEIIDLKMLKLLGLRMCNIERKISPFKVIERCSQLEELYFSADPVQGWNKFENINEVPQDICHHPKLQRYYIDLHICDDDDDTCDDDDKLLNCFNTMRAIELISKSMFKELIIRAEVLDFWETREAEWKNLVNGEMMNDLIKLRLFHVTEIRYLIDRDIPDGSFRKLQFLKLLDCKKLQHLTFDGNLKLPHLKSLHLKRCPMLQPSVFQLQSSVALCIDQLEEIVIEDCEELTSLITYESLEEEEKCSYGLPFKRLKSLHIKRCGKLELVWPIFSAGDLPLLENIFIRNCKEMKYIFGEYHHQHEGQPSLTELELGGVPSFIAIFRDVEATKESCGSSKRIETFHAVKCLMRQPFSLQNIRKMRIVGPLKLTSLFSISVATTLIMLEELSIIGYEELKHIIGSEEEDDDSHLNCSSIFPKLQELCIVQCNKLEFIFPSTLLSGGLKKLQEIWIEECHGLKHVFGEYNNNDQNVNVIPIDLPTLKTLSLQMVPEMISLCASNYYVVCPSLQHISLNHFGASHQGTEKGLIIRSCPCPDFMFSSQLRHSNMETSKDYVKMIMGMQNLTRLDVGHSEKTQEIFNVEGVHHSEGPVTLNLEEMKLEYLVELRHIYKDPNNILNLLNLKVLKFKACDKLRALFTTSTMKSLPQLSYLEVKECKELVHIIEKDDDHDYERSAYGCSHHHQLCFPMLKRVVIDSCHRLRSLFRISTSSNKMTMQKLFILQNVFLNLSKLELNNLPELRVDCLGIKYRETTKELQATHSNAGQAMLDMGEAKMEQEKETKELMTSDSPNLTEESRALKERLENFQTLECLMRQPLILQNIKEMKLYGCSKLKSLFSVSIASTIMLEKLEITACDELKDIIIKAAGDDDDHLNYTSIFPNLEFLKVYHCNKLEFLLPSSTLSGGLQKLQSIDIYRANGLKYIFGAYNKNDQNINVVSIDLPAMKRLSLRKVPEMVSLCASNYYVVWPSLQHISLQHFWRDFMASPQLKLKMDKGLITGSSLFPDFLQPRQPNKETAVKHCMKIIMGMQNLTRLDVSDSETIEEIINLEGIQSERPVTLNLQEMKLYRLGELKHIYKDPNNILILVNLKVLKILSCDKLKALFTTSMVKGLQRLSFLEVSYCRRLVDIIEEDHDYETKAYGPSHQLCFPILESIYIDNCDGLRCLFKISATSNMLPNLKTLKIQKASRLEEVFRCQQEDDTEEMLIQNVFPNLSEVELENLPKLTTICWWINFDSVPVFEVVNCPKYIGHKDVDSENKSPTEELQATHSNTNQDMMPSMGEAKREQRREVQEFTTSASIYFTESSKGSMEDIIEEVPVSKSAMVPSLSNSAAMESEDGHKMKELTPQLQWRHLGETKTTTPFDDDSIGVMLKERDQVGPILEDVMVATLSADLAHGNSLDLMKAESRKETTKTYQQELGRKTAISVGESFPEDIATMKTSVVTTSINSQARGSHSGTSELTYKETDREEGKVVPASKLSATTSLDVESIIESNPEDTATTKEKTSATRINSQAGGLQSDPLAQVTPSNKGTLEQRPPQNYATEEDKTENKSKDLDSEKQPRLVGLLDIEMARSPYEASKDISEKVSTSGAAPDSILFDLEFTKKEQANPSVLAEKATKADLSRHSQSCSLNPSKDFRVLAHVIPPRHHKPQIGVAGSSSPRLEIGEIFQLVELKAGEPALLANALERYPQLRLPRERRTNRIIGWSYRVLVDILVMLTTKTPCTITASDRSILEDNLGEATILGFDNEWIESVRTKISGSDMLDVLAAEKEMIEMEAKLKTCEIALDNVHKQRSEWLEAIDSQLFGLLEDRKKLVLRMAEIRDLMGSKDKPFGF